MSITLGKDAKLYYASGVVATSWTELTNVKDVSLDIEAGESDVTTRGAGGWTATKATLRSVSLEFEMMWDTAADGFSDIRDAHKNGTTIALAIYDAAITTATSQGLQADFNITGFSKNEPLNEAATVSVTAKPAYSSVQAAWVTIVADPGDAQAIPVTQSASVRIETSGAETRTLAAPTLDPQSLQLHMTTDGGDAVITCFTGVNDTGNNTITMDAVDDIIRLEARYASGNLRWRVVSNTGCALSTV